MLEEERGAGSRQKKLCRGPLLAEVVFLQSQLVGVGALSANKRQNSTCNVRRLRVWRVLVA